MTTDKPAPLGSLMCDNSSYHDLPAVQFGCVLMFSRMNESDYPIAEPAGQG